MSITFVSRYRGNNLETAIKAARTNAPILSENGASTVQMSRITTGPHTGQLVVILKYPDWETYAAAQKKQAANKSFQNTIKMLDAAGLTVEERTILVDVPF